MNIVQYIESFGIRPSLHRTEVMRYLYSSHDHPSVDMIYDALSPKIPTLSRTTVYNVLKLFVEKGAVRDITIDPRQSRYDADISEHAHFLCESCGTLYDVKLDTFEIKTNHMVSTKNLYLKGICNNCLTKK